VPRALLDVPLCGSCGSKQLTLATNEYCATSNTNNTNKASNNNNNKSGGQVPTSPSTEAATAAEAEAATQTEAAHAHVNKFSAPHICCTFRKGVHVFSTNLEHKLFKVFFLNSSLGNIK